MTTSGNDVEALDVLVGTWTVEMHVPVEPPADVLGQTTFEWLPGRRFLIQRWTADHPDAPDGIAVIGPGDTPGEFIQHYFDSRGVERVYRMRLSDRQWELWRDGDDFSQRFIGTLSEDGDTIEGRWERADDGKTWQVDFPLTYRRV